MSIEYDILKKYRLNRSRLVPYGFRKEGDEYMYSKLLLDGSFRADITIGEEGVLSGRVMDTDLMEEYTNFRVLNVTGEIANSVKAEYEELLQDIADQCYVREFFVSGQANRITGKIRGTYGVEPEFLWEKYPDFGVFRNEGSEKWFGLIMNIGRNKLILGAEGEVEVINVKLDDRLLEFIDHENVFPAYHMSKKSWASVALDDSLTDEEIMDMVQISYELSDIRGRKRA